MKQKKTSAQAWCDLDVQHSLTGKLPLAEGASPALQTYLAEFSDFDAKKAEGLTLAYNIEPLIHARALLYRGKIQEALAVVETGLLKNEDLGMVTELLQEKARACFFDGQYAEGMQLIGLLLKQEIAPVTRLALLQMKALAEYECGSLAEASATIDQADSLSQIFPMSTSVFYIASLRCRITARRQSVDAARRELCLTFKSSLARQRLDAELLTVFLRCEIDLRRLENRSYSALALANYWLEAAVGEELYAGLAALDIVTSNEPSLAKEFTPVFEELRARFPRLQKLWNEIAADSPESQTRTAETIRNAQCETATLNEASGSRKSPVDFLYFYDFDVFMSLRERAKSLKSLQNQDVLRLAVRALASGPLTKPEFFAALWGQQKYVSHLHDNLIRSVVFRAKKRMGLEIQLKDKMVSAPGLLVVRCED